MEYKIIRKSRRPADFSRRGIWIRWIVCGLLIITASADFISFYIEKKFWDFDASPLLLFTKNILIIFIIKYGTIFALCYLLLHVKANDYWAYLLIMMAVYLIIFQALGFISNRQVAAANPPIEQAPSVQVRLQTGINLSLLYAYYPIIYSMLGFFLWNIGWRELP